VTTLAQSAKKIAVIAHRGEHLQHPENSIAGIQAAASMGADYVELDVRTTADGGFILSHDATLDRTTNGHGPVSGLALAEIRQLELKNGSRVPTFDEALETLRATATSLYLDAKQISADAIVRLLQIHKMMERTVVYGSLPLLQALAAQGPLPRVMPEARSVETLQTLLRELKPRVVAFDHNDWKPEIIAIAKQASVDLFVDRLGPNDNESAWAEAIRSGATGIQTDHPAGLLGFLKR
jgi:glycerophosphoryl diester phosphodiesterase